jgi:hypothetical protein
MASTSQLLTWIELEMHGWTREGVRGSRALLSEAHRLLLSAEREQNVLLGTGGELPFFTTQNNVHLYNAPATVWKIEAVVVDDPASLPDTPNDVTSTSGVTLREWRYHEVEFAGITYYTLDNVRTFPWNRSQVARVEFMGMNPSATTSLYRRWAYRRPTEITSDRIQHEMPGTTDIDYLMPATMKLMDAIDDHQKMEQARLYIERELKPKVWGELDSGEQGLSGYCERRLW